MDPQLLVHVRVEREQFRDEHFLSEDPILALVSAGSFMARWEDRQILVREGEGMVFFKDRPYFRRVITPLTLHLFRYSATDPVFQQEHIRFADRARIRSTIQALENLEQHPNPLQYQEHLFRDLLFQYLAENPPHRHPKEDPAMEQAVLQLQNSLDQKLALPELAAQCGLSYAQFFRRFQAYTGRTPWEYLAFCRLQRAKELLTDPARTVQQVAYACGFENEYYFSNFFKKQTGVSPTLFRRSLL